MIECEIVGLNELKTKLRKLPQIVADATVTDPKAAGLVTSAPVVA